LHRGHLRSTIASHSPLNISVIVRDRGLIPKDRQYEMAYGDSNNCHVTEAMTSHDIERSMS